MALFFKEHNIEKKNWLPFMVDIALYLTEGKLLEQIKFEEKVLQDCNINLKEVLRCFAPAHVVVGCYLKLAMLADEKEGYSKYLEVYEPIIRLFESGGYFVYRERGMSIFNSGLLTLSNWYELHVDKKWMIICDEEIDCSAHVYLEKLENSSRYLIIYGIHNLLVKTIFTENEGAALAIYEGVKVDLKKYVNTTCPDEKGIWHEPFVSQWYK